MKDSSGRKVTEGFQQAPVLRLSYKVCERRREVMRSGEGIVMLSRKRMPAVDLGVVCCVISSLSCLIHCPSAADG